MNPTRIADRYDVIRPLGRGSFAQTLLARDARLGREVAIKVLNPRAAGDWKAYELFEREAMVLRDLRHHGIPAVHESFRAPWDGAEAAFLVMEYIPGTSLAQLIAEQRHLDSDSVTELFIELLGVLDYLHTRVPPILHRDIKPANVMIRTDGSPALVDFGAVRNVFRDPTDSGSTIVGTYGYVPYEQMMGQASPASDLYALAATFLHLITGREPPTFLTDAGRLVVPATLPCGEPLRSVLTRMLAAAPADRYQSARDVRSVLRGGPTAIVPAGSPGTALARAAVPRPITGETAALLKRLAHSPWQLMSPQEKPGTKWSFSDVFLVGLFSILTAGVLPAVFFSMYASRKRRFKRFLTHGLPATARVIDMTPEDVAFDVKITRVRYEFTVDGRVYRDSDTVLPSISTRWDPGQQIQVLYIAEADYDSVIVSTA